MISIQRLARMLTVGRHVAATAGVVALVVEYGFRLPSWAAGLVHALEGAIVILFVASALARWAAAADRRAHAREHLPALGLVALLLAGLGLAYAIPAPGGKLAEGLREAELTSFSARIVILLQAYIVARVLLAVTGLQSRLAALQVRPAFILIGSFVAVIALGTLLLWLPRARAEARPPIRFVEAFFTATSATCVTGLTVRDTGNDFSRTGQVVILLLIQVGGLGLVAFTGLFALLQRRAAGLRHLVALREMFSLRVIGELAPYLRRMLAITLLAEALGAALLWTCRDESGLRGGERLHWSLFHAVSAFCNAGFALKPSFIDSAGHVGLNAALAGLIVVGGIGFPVLAELLRYRVSSLLRFRRRRRLDETALPPSRLSVHTRAALVVSGTLLLGGAAAFWLLEGGGALAGRPLQEQACISIFQSVSARTAGFNTVDIGGLGTATLLLLIVLMAIGASPASTGGGMKTVTVAVLAGTVVSMMRGRPLVELGRRTVPALFVHAAVTIVVLYALEAVAFTVLLAALEPAVPLRQSLFEVVSALSTVGLSTGITAGLGDAAKTVLCLAMLAGRLGPLTILLSVSTRAPAAGYEYPREELIVA